MFKKQQERLGEGVEKLIKLAPMLLGGGAGAAAGAAGASGGGAAAAGGMMAKGGGTKNFKSSEGYKKWLAYGHATGVFEDTPGNQKVSIRGKNKNVKHAKGGKTLQSMAYAPGGPPVDIVTRGSGNSNPLGSQNWGSGTETGYSEPNYNVNEGGIPEKAPAYGSERQEMEEAGIDYGAEIASRGFDDPNLGAGQPQNQDFGGSREFEDSQFARMESAPRKEIRQGFGDVRGFVKPVLGAMEPREKEQKKGGIWDFINSLGLKNYRKEEKESGNKFFDLSRREKREARKGGYGWKSSYWDNPDADTQQFRMEDKGKRGREGKFSLFGNVFKGTGTSTPVGGISRPMF